VSKRAQSNGACAGVGVFCSRGTVAVVHRKLSRKVFTISIKSSAHVCRVFV
jgi:hypothetical protein